MPRFKRSLLFTLNQFCYNPTKPTGLTKDKMKQQPKRNLTLLYLLIFACAIALIFWIFRSTPTVKVTNIPISQVVTMSQADQIKSISMQGQNISIVGTDGTQYTSFLRIT